MGTCINVIVINQTVSVLEDGNENIKHISLNIILPLLIGGLLYIVFRNDSLLMHKWFDFISLERHINNLL